MIGKLPFGVRTLRWAVRSPGRLRIESTKVTCIRAAARQIILAVSTLGTIAYALLAMAIFHAFLVMVAIGSVDDVLRAKPILPAHPKNAVGR
jgi:hypothetical protein